MTLLDELVPVFDFRSHHETLVAAPPHVVAKALETYRSDREGSFFVRLLFRFRGLAAPRGTLREALQSGGFSPLSERPGEEIVYGIAGRFWAVRERENLISVRDAAGFRSFDEPGCAKAVIAIHLASGPSGRTHLSTETRVRCVDRGARRSFGLYWFLIKPFSGLIRRSMLRGIRRRAERLHATSEPD